MNADTEAFFEQALKHVLDEAAKLLRRNDLLDVHPVIVALNDLAAETHRVRSTGLHRIKSIESLMSRATDVERICDEISLRLWRPIPVSVSAIYQKIGSSLHSPPEGRGAASELRSHYDKIRIRLLQQSLGAKMLSNPSDRGSEIERIWQQFLQNALGESVRVLQGGVICDYQGNTSKHQIDLIVVPAEALVTFPSGAEDGKVHVPIDQVISAIMVTSNLTADKLLTDWENLIDIPSYKQLEEDHPHLKGHPWPLRYIVGGQSDPLEGLTAAWINAAETLKEPGPQFVVTLDSGFLFSGATKWPRPRFSQEGISDVRTEEGVFRGLGLAWLLLQHQGRLAALHHRALGPINRQSERLTHAALKDAMPSTWSPRFNMMLLDHELAGNLEWAYTDKLAHNLLHVTALVRKGEIGKSLSKNGFVQRSAWPIDTSQYRWFRYGAKRSAGDFVAVEEWLEVDSLKGHRSRIAVFNSNTGEEVTGASVNALENLIEAESLLQGLADQTAGPA